MDNERIRFGARCELARRDFWQYCNLKAPGFYQPCRAYLVSLCRGLQAFYESGDEILVVNAPPRHGKSRTAQLFTEWVLGNNRFEKVMTGSYNEILSTTFSKGVRNDIQEAKADLLKPVFSDVFPGVRIKRGDAAINLWSLEGGYNNYLATSPCGTATGFGCSLMIIDDLIKTAQEAYNADVLEKHWDWYTNTMLSRLEEGGKIIIIMTRWATGDLAGRALQQYAAQGARLRHISMRAVQDDGTMLCPQVLSRETFESKKKLQREEIVSANYQQIPIDLKGRLYQSFRTYTDVPESTAGKPLFSRVCCYTDTADTGSDYLCSIIYGVYRGEAYVLDVYYTKDGMEITEQETAKRLFARECNVAKIESNNGGRGFARNVGRILREQFHTNRCRIEWFHQSANKQARILTNAAWVCDHIYFPQNWRDRWPAFYKAMYAYQKEGKNAHDDAPDATTGIAEQICRDMANTIGVSNIRI